MRRRHRIGSAGSDLPPVGTIHVHHPQADLTRPDSVVGPGDTSIQDFVLHVPCEYPSRDRGQIRSDRVLPRWTDEPCLPTAEHQVPHNVHAEVYPATGSITRHTRPNTASLTAPHPTPKYSTSYLIVFDCQS